MAYGSQRSAWTVPCFGCVKLTILSAPQMRKFGEMSLSRTLQYEQVRMSQPHVHVMRRGDRRRR
jgi:hypothetical protein